MPGRRKEGRKEEGGDGEGERRGGEGAERGKDTANSRAWGESRSPRASGTCGSIMKAGDVLSNDTTLFLFTKIPAERTREGESRGEAGSLAGGQKGRGGAMRGQIGRRWRRKAPSRCPRRAIACALKRSRRISGVCCVSMPCGHWSCVTGPGEGPQRGGRGMSLAIPA